jgi:hypothetical protein
VIKVNKGLPFRVIIAGGREFNDYDLLVSKADALLSNYNNVVVVSGTAHGADELGERYARQRGYKIERHPANWDKLGKSAGYIRNKEMAECSDALIAFWDGESKGTKIMIDLAKKNNLKVRVVMYKECVQKEQTRAPKQREYETSYGEDLALNELLNDDVY